MMAVSGMIRGRAQAGEGPAYPGSSAGHPRSAAGEGPAYPGSNAGRPSLGPGDVKSHRAQFGIGTAALSSKPAASQGGRDQSKPEIAAMNKLDRLGSVRNMVQNKLVTNPVIDKRSVKQKLADAQTRSIGGS